MKPILARVTVFAPLAALALAAGCSLTRPAPVKQAYLLDPPPPPVSATTRPGTLRVGVVTVAAPFRDRPLVVREAELRYETDYYREWIVPPSAMIGETLARSLDRSRVFGRVVPPGTAPDSDFVIDAFVSALYADSRDASKPGAELAIGFYVSRANTSGAPVWSKEYRRRIPISAGSSDTYVAAQNEALGDILAELARDLATAQLPPLIRP
jgi:cholesterol transport system auxiliary component